ncbi:hypothetical protein [Yersinia pseudotuberculosis]|uniref:hypothetical protein n=1 Tax=Yersinia pseudotuberculosis TaxID=633 RepID=UPI0005E010E1|nr:hypothetical protein [Yersinia pseudotuberculosis]CNL05118.1 Uncharacterised protein [Yersinia pseudotuberculosis]
MNGLIVIIVCIALSVFCYKKMANRCRVKGRGKLTTFFISLSSSSLVFLVSMIIGVANFFPEAESESGKVSNVKEEKHTTLKYNCTLSHIEEIKGRGIQKSWQTPATLIINNNDFSISLIDPETGKKGLLRSGTLAEPTCDENKICTKSRESITDTVQLRSILKVSNSPIAAMMLTSLDAIMITNTVNDCHEIP